MNTTQNLSLLKHKIVFVGDEEAGKTSIINRIIFEIAPPLDYKPTIGVDFICKTFNMPKGSVRAQFWDTAGQERFFSLIPSYIRDSKTAIIVYSVTDRKSFISLRKWIDIVRDERGKDVNMIIVGNKIDVNERVVSKEEAQGLAKQEEADYFEVSAKDGTNTTNLILSVVFKVLENQQQ